MVSKGMTPADELLIRSIPQALAVTERVCSSVNVGSTKTGINMDAVKLMGEIVLETAKASARIRILWDVPNWWYSVMHRMTTPLWQELSMVLQKQTVIINVGVSGPGVVKTALEQVRGREFRDCSVKRSSVQHSKLHV